MQTAAIQKRESEPETTYSGAAAHPGNLNSVILSLDKSIRAI